MLVPNVIRLSQVVFVLYYTRHSALLHMSLGQPWHSPFPRTLRELTLV